MSGARASRPGAALAAGVAAAIGGRVLLRRLLLARFRRDVRRLNAGDYSSLLSAYADDAVIRFNHGPHRWSGEHRGRAAIERFFVEFTAAGVRGALRDLWIAGPPWALTVVARFDDHANAPDGRRLYANSAVIVLRTRWGKIVEHDDFYEDTARIDAFERELQQLGVGAGAP